MIENLRNVQSAITGILLLGLNDIMGVVLCRQLIQVMGMMDLLYYYSIMHS